MSLSIFPGEIVARIFFYSSQDDLYEYIKVCKLWRKEGSVGIYKDITLYSYHLRFLKCITETGSDGISRIRDYVETLSFVPRKTSTSETLSQEQFNLLMFSLPNLRVLYFDPRDDAQIIVNYLLYFKIIARYTKIEEVSIPDFSYSNKQIRRIRRFHYMANRILHRQITSLTLHDLDIRMLKYSGRRTTTSLQKFNSLKHLSLYNFDSNDFFISQADINPTSILNACPNLETFEFKGNTVWTHTLSRHDIYPYLTSLKLKMPGISVINTEFIMDHIPHLKRLDLTMYSSPTFSELCRSLGPHLLSRFVSYIQQLHYFKLTTNSGAVLQDYALFWEVIRDIYDDSMRCNLFISFKTAKKYSEDISFDREKKTFNVYCDWISSADNDDTNWIHHVNYFNFASVQIENRIRQVSMCDLMHSVFLEQQPYMSFMNNGARVILDKDLLGYVSLPQAGYHRPPIRCAYFGYLPAEHGILPLVGSYSPLIKNIAMVNCQFPNTTDKRHYLIDLCHFRNIQEFTFDVDALLEKDDTITEVYIQYTNDIDTVYYCFRRNGSMKRLPDDTAIPESAHIIELRYTRLKNCYFKRKHHVIFKMLD